MRKIVKGNLSHLLLIVLLTSFLQPNFAQDYGLILRKDIIESNHVQSISIHLKSGAELGEIDSLEVGHVKLDPQGRIVYEKYYRLFDVILYSEEYTYNYNSNGQLVEKIETQLEYPKDQADSSLLDITGFGPSTRKWIYKYNKNGKLKEEFEFLSATDSEPIIQINYSYDLKGRLVKEHSTYLRNPKMTIYSNAVTRYAYDNFNRIKEEKMHWTTDNVRWVKQYTYNSHGFIDSESIIHDNFDRGKQTRFEYEKDSLSRIYQTKIEDKAWFKEISIEHYNESYKSWEYHTEYLKPAAMVHFEYDDKHLLQRETWYNDKNKLKYHFDIDYTFY